MMVNFGRVVPSDLLVPMFIKAAQSVTLRNQWETVVVARDAGDGVGGKDYGAVAYLAFRSKDGYLVRRDSGIRIVLLPLPHDRRKKVWHVSVEFGKGHEMFPFYNTKVHPSKYVLCGRYKADFDAIIHGMQNMVLEMTDRTLTKSLSLGLTPE